MLIHYIAATKVRSSVRFRPVITATAKVYIRPAMSPVLIVAAISTTLRKTVTQSTLGRAGVPSLTRQVFLARWIIRVALYKQLLLP